MSGRSKVRARKTSKNSPVKKASFSKTANIKAAKTKAATTKASSAKRAAAKAVSKTTAGKKPVSRKRKTTKSSVNTSKAVSRKRQNTAPKPRQTKAVTATSKPRRKPRAGSQRRASQKPRKRTQQSRSTRPFLKRWYMRTLIWSSFAASLVVLMFAGLVSYYAYTLPDPLTVGLEKKTQSVKIYSSDGVLLAERGLSQAHVPLKAMPDYLPKAVIAIEDRRFYSHFGFDPVSFIRALYTNMQAGHVVQGGSTLSQQLAKNLFLNANRTLARKAQEVIMAFWLEYKFTKDELLELYLNRVYFGDQAYGVAAASQTYFDKKPKDLTLAESAMLAGLLKAPTRLNPKRSLGKSQARAKLVIEAMERAGFITALSSKAAQAHPAKPVLKQARRKMSYVLDWVSELVPGFVNDTKNDLVVEVTIDKALQDKAQRALRKVLAKHGKSHKASQAALVLMGPGGSIKAMIGGRDYQESQFNRAIQARRQPGSAFKPFVYLTAIEHGMTPTSIVHDEPIEFGNWQPKNYGNRYRGRITITRALTYSSNVAAVQLMQEVSPGKVIKTAKRLGVQSKLSPNLSLALGTDGVSLLELTTAYVPFSNGGYGVLPAIIRRISTEQGKVIYERHNSELGQIIKSEPLGAMNYMLHQVVQRGTGRRARLRGHDVAGKTGTSQDFRDAWFVGYSAHYTAGVWVGNDDNSSMKGVTGGSLPIMIWSEVMKEAHKGLNREKLAGMESYQQIARQQRYQQRLRARRRARREQQYWQSQSNNNFFNSIFGNN